MAHRWSGIAARLAVATTITLVLSALRVTHAQTVTYGCGTAATTVQTGFFTMNGKCFNMYRTEAAGSSRRCDERCARGGMACVSYVTRGTQGDCTALINAYLASPANEASIWSTTSMPMWDQCALFSHIDWWRLGA